MIPFTVTGPDTIVAGLAAVQRYPLASLGLLPGMSIFVRNQSTAWFYVTWGDTSKGIDTATDFPVRNNAGFNERLFRVPAGVTHLVVFLGAVATGSVRITPCTMA